MSAAFLPLAILAVVAAIAWGVRRVRDSPRGFVLGTHRSHALDVSSLKAAARLLGLRVERGEIVGTLDGLAVTVDQSLDETGRAFVRIVVEWAPYSTSPVHLSIDWPPLEPATPSVRCGDDWIDDAHEFRAQGDPSRVVALLDEPRRLLVRSMFGDVRLRAARGRVEAESKRALTDARDLADAIRRVVSLARALGAREPSVPAALLHNLRNDSSAGVRRRSLELLLDRHRDAPETEQAVRNALVSQDGRLRLLAAKHLGEEGFATLVELALGDDPHRSVALRYLTSHFPASRVTPVLDRLLHAPPPMQRFAIEEVGRLRARDFLDTLLAIVVDADVKTLLVLAAALGDVGDARAVPDLLAMLRHTDGLVRREAARVLGALGDHAVIGPLRACAREHPADAELKAAVGTALRRIVARCGPAEPGGLALTGPDEQGALSVAAGEEGALAVADARPTRKRSE